MATCEHLTPEHAKESFVNTLIYKDECMRCFSNPEHPDGLNVCLKCLQGFCVDMGHSKHHFSKTNHALVLNIKKVLKEEHEEGGNKITKLAIGKEGGADIEDRFDTIATLNCLSCEKELDSSGEYIKSIVDGVLSSKSAFFESQVGEWEQEIKECEHVKNLDQTGAQQIAAKAMAHCESCDLKANLWLCMSCGKLGCGRQQYGGLDGNNHGIGHYEEVGHPVVCKLGTITANGSASLYCYQCNDDVEDKNLKQHLQNLGIDMGLQIKTEKTMTEINLEKNLALTLSKIVEDGRTLTPVFGSGYTGMINLGNSCYLNSVIQVLFSYEKIRKFYDSIYEEHHNVCEKLTTECFDCQMSKLAHGLMSGRYSERKEAKKPEHDMQTEEDKNEMDIYQDGIRPQAFKNLIGKGHDEFASGRQQDAQEYLQHLFEVMEKEEKSRGRSSPAEMFDFEIQHRYECHKCNGVAYVKEKTNQLNLLIVSHENPDIIPEEEEMQNALSRYFGDEIISKQCPGCNDKQDFTRNTRFLNLPEVLIVVTQRFTFQNWTPTKLNTSFKVILGDLDLETFKHPGGIQPGENALPEGGEVEVEEEAEVSQDLLNMCLMMGLPELPAKHALHQTGNSSADAAVTWYFSNMENPDINGPLPTVKKMVKQGGFAAKEEKKEDSSASVDENALAMLTAMGMPDDRSKKALIKFNNNFDAALDYMTSHGPEEDDFDVAMEEAKEAPEWKPDQNPGIYNLDAFITHLGNSIHSGHYVAHIKKGNDWVLYNDHKVAITSDPPHEKAFIYFFRKKNSD